MNVAVDPSGNVIFGGTLTGSANFGGGALSNPPENDGGYGTSAFIAKFSPSGAYTWASVFGATEGNFGRVLGTDASGNVYAEFSFLGGTNFGGGPLTSPSGYFELAVVKFDAAGAYQWARTFGTAANPYQPGGNESGTVDSSGNVTLAGGFQGSLDFGGGLLTGSGTTNVYLVRLDSTGGYAWGETFSSASYQVNCAAIALDPSGDVLLGGSFAQSIDLGGGSLSSGAASPTLNAFLAKYSSTGTYVWATVLTDGEQDQVTGIGADPMGNILMTGTFYLGVNLGSGDLTSAGGSDIFLGKLAPSGAGIWSKSFGDSGDQMGGALTVDGAGNPAIAGGCYGPASVDFGGGALDCSGTSVGAMYVAQFYSSGAYGWAYSGGQTDSNATTLAFSQTSDLVLGGCFTGSVSLASAELQTPGGASYDALLAEFER